MNLQAIIGMIENWYNEALQKEADWKGQVGGLLGGALMMATPMQAQPATTAPQQQQVQATYSGVYNGDIAEIVKSFENNKAYKPGGWNERDKLWHIYSDKGKPAIGYGHDLEATELDRYDKGASDNVVNQILAQDIQKKQAAANGVIPAFSNLPQYIQNAIVVGIFRGDIGRKASPQTLKHINSNQWAEAAKAFRDSGDYRKGGGVQKRMESIAQAFEAYGRSLNPKTSLKAP